MFFIHWFEFHQTVVFNANGLSTSHKWQKGFDQTYINMVLSNLYKYGQLSKDVYFKLFDSKISHVL